MAIIARACVFTLVATSQTCAEDVENTSKRPDSFGNEIAGEQSSSGEENNSDQLATCDRLAADPKDTDKPTGVAGVEVPTAEAIEPCRAAVDADPQNARLNYQTGRAYQAQDVTNAFFYFDRARSLGSVRATVAVADAYNAGAGIAKDEAKALELYKQTAIQGDPGAIIKLRKYYSSGPSKSLILAIKWLSSIEDGDAFIALGDLYVNEVKNDAVALKWYRKAADLRTPEAYKRLGWAYYNGRGVPVDPAQAIEWDKLAWDRYPEVASRIAKSYGFLGDTEQMVSWLERGIARGDALSARTMAIEYLYGSAIGINQLKALEYFQRAADLGHVSSLVDIGRMHQSGEGLEKNTPLAIEYLRKAAEKGDVEAFFWLATMYEALTPPDYRTANDWYKKSAEAGEKTAMYNLAFNYREGRGGKRNYTEALAWFKKAAEQGDADAMNQVGRFYAGGWGVKRNDAEAGRWYEKAGAAGQGWGNSNLAVLFSRGNGVNKDIELSVKLQELGMKQSSEVCNEFKKSWSNWTPEFLRAFQSRLAEGYSYKGAIDGRLGSGSMAALTAICQK